MPSEERTPKFGTPFYQFCEFSSFPASGPLDRLYKVHQGDFSTWAARIPNPVGKNRESKWYSTLMQESEIHRQPAETLWMVTTKCNISKYKLEVKYVPPISPQGLVYPH